MNTNYEEQLANICSGIADSTLEADDETINEENDGEDPEKTRQILLDALPVIVESKQSDLMVINKSDYQSDRQSLVAQTERAQIKIGHLENEWKQLNENYWDLLEALQDGVERELRNFVEHFEPTEKEKKFSNNIRTIVSEIYDEYVAKGRELSGKSKGA